MAQRQSNPRLALRLFAVIAAITALAMGVGLPALLGAQDGANVSDPEALATITRSILGGGMGLALVLFVASFFVRGRIA